MRNEQNVGWTGLDWVMDGYPLTVMNTRAPAMLLKVIFVVYKSGGKLYLKNLINFLPIPKSKLKCGIS